jgi:glycine dehydrogenase subunit 1
VNHANSVKLADLLAGVPGIQVLTQAFFNEITIRLPRPAAQVVEELAGRGILAGVPASRLWPGAGLDELLLLASTEVNTDEDRAALAYALKDAL